MTRGRFRPNVVSWDEIGSGSDSPFDNPDLHDYLILAEGDSWFTIAGIPTSNLLYSMRFKKMTMIVNCGFPGDTIKHMSDIVSNQTFKETLSSDGLSWDLLFLSGGGNDLIDNANNILLKKGERQGLTINQASDYCKQDVLNDLMAEIQHGYREIVSLRDSAESPAIGKPVITHTYDYATARNSPSRFFSVPLLGPWLFKALTEAEIPDEAWVEITDYLIDQLAEAIIELDTGTGTNPLDNFHVIDTRDTLTRAKTGTTGQSGDWLNEIHPDFEGYKKIAKLMDTKAMEFL